MRGKIDRLSVDSLIEILGGTGARIAVVVKTRESGLSVGAASRHLERRTTFTGDADSIEGFAIQGLPALVWVKERA